MSQDGEAGGPHQLLNPVLRGWAQYHRPVVAKETFSKLDSLLWWRLTRWARRRHPTKNPKWVAGKYWLTIEGRPEFAVRTPAKDGTPKWVRLYRLADTEIVRHQKVKGDYSPFDPKWEAYGEDLRAKRLLKSKAYNKQWASLFLSQHGHCAAVRRRHHGGHRLARPSPDSSGGGRVGRAVQPGAVAPGVPCPSACQWFESREAGP